MSNSVRKALGELFADISKSKSALKRVLNPSTDGAGSRVYPPRNAKNDEKYGIRIDKGEPVQGKSNTIKLKLQINSNAASKTLRELAQKNPHNVVATAEVDNTQDVTEENMERLKQDFLDTIDV